ncbi:hypothetical protein DFH09DRAFT_1337978 [Mycena vulgaris]|nr:hypothetical protein DFH09DRAFT_1337978 [Mycena vulgaris]
MEMNIDVDGGEVQHPQEFIGPLLPGSYLRVIPHRHSTDSTPIIIPIDSADSSDPVPSPKPFLREGDYGRAPWFPFQTRADFEATEIAVKGLLPKYLTDNLLGGASNTWNSKGRSRVTLQNHKQMESVLATARKYGVRFKKGTILATYNGERQRIDFEYRDPWDWITRLLEDNTLGPHMIYNFVRKYYCEGTEKETWCERIIDEPNTAETWDKYESELPDADPYPHCLLPLHFWLDEGLVAKRLTMHPMVLRPVFLPGNIRNASGNGGGVLLGYMNTVRDPSDPDDRKTVETLAFAKFKMKVYQRVLAVIFASLRSRSWNGEPIECCDGLIRVFHPGIIMDSLDGKEAAYFNACRAALANHPRPKCLVHKDDLSELLKAFKGRTTDTMKAVVETALNAVTKTEKEAILKKNGLHGHFLWGFRFSDPYAAYSYDTLHSDDLGKWGHHLWPLLLDALQDIGGKGTFAQNMREFSRWPGLKHFNQVTTIHFTDGQTFYDILKSVLPCIVQIFPRNSVLVHCIRAYQRLRMMTGMHCMPSRRLERLQKLIKDYEYWCSVSLILHIVDTHHLNFVKRVAAQYGKSFDFFKQHATSHIVKDIRDKGTTNHGSTRPGEGFQQEAAEAYNRTNFKDVASQMNRVDETQEAIARIRMAIDKYDKQQEEDERADEDDFDAAPKISVRTSASWRFGAPQRLTNSKAFEQFLVSAGHPVKHFDLMLRDFVAENFPGDRVSFEQHIQIQPFKSAHITYQSLEDWRGLRDIVRCNPRFHGHPRYDSILLNSDAPGMVFARISALLRCTLESTRQFDVALVQEFRQSKWKPNTNWAGCQVYEETKQYSLLLVDYVIRGALLTPATDSGRENLHFFVDTVDPDMFLRADRY